MQMLVAKSATKPAIITIKSPMIKKSIFLLMILSFANAVYAQEVVAEKSDLSPVFYAIVVSLIIVVGLVAFLIRKLDYSLNQVLRSMGVALGITLAIELLLLVIMALFRIPKIYCKAGADCPDQLGMFLGFLPFTSILIFVITALIYFSIKAVRSK